MYSFDESDPRFLIVHTGEEHPTPDDYRRLYARWIERLDAGDRFGLIMLNEFDHDHDDEDEEHRQQEAEFTRLLNDFRRDYRDRTAQRNTGYVTVVTEAFVEHYYDNNPDAIKTALEHLEMFAQYNWGIPGYGTTSLNEAKAWLADLHERTPQAAAAPETGVREAALGGGSVGLFYGSSTGITEYIADEVQAAWERAGLGELPPINIGKLKDLSALLDYDNLILGIPTWNIGQLQDDWEIMLPQLDDLDFTGKNVAIFGVGDQYGYPDNFIDAVGILGEKLVERGAQLVGRWYDDHYEFSESLAFKDGKFMGLAIDDLNQSGLNDERIGGWIQQLVGEFALQPFAVK